MGLSVTKGTNQYFGKYFERTICSAINKEDFINSTGYENFTDEDLSIMQEDAKNVADYLSATNATWVGNKTEQENCDIILNDNEHIEIKYVSQGTGTYFNTSIYEFAKYGFDFKEYLEKFNFYNLLSEYFSSVGIVPNRKNKSPISRENSSIIRHKYTDIYEEKIKPVDEQMRKQFIADLINHFQNNTEDLYDLLTNLLNKNTATIKKGKPDRIIIYNYLKDTISEIDLASIDIKQKQLTFTEKGFSIGNIRLQIGWQNGIGNNPTIRVFIN